MARQGRGAKERKRRREEGERRRRKKGREGKRGPGRSPGKILKMRFYPVSRPRWAFCFPFLNCTHSGLPAGDVSAGSDTPSATSGFKRPLWWPSIFLISFEIPHSLSGSPGHLRAPPLGPHPTGDRPAPHPCVAPSNGGNL